MFKGTIIVLKSAFSGNVIAAADSAGIVSIVSLVGDQVLTTTWDLGAIPRDLAFTSDSSSIICVGSFGVIRLTPGAPPVTLASARITPSACFVEVADDAVLVAGNAKIFVFKLKHSNLNLVSTVDLPVPLGITDFKIIRTEVGFKVMCLMHNRLVLQFPLDFTHSPEIHTFESPLRHASTSLAGIGGAYAIGSLDGRIAIKSTGSPVRCFRAHRIVSGSLSQVPKTLIPETMSQEQKSTPTTLVWPVNDITWTPDGRLISAGGDGAVLLWQNNGDVSVTVLRPVGNLSANRIAVTNENLLFAAVGEGCDDISALNSPSRLIVTKIQPI